MKRGDVVLAAASGDYGKPRPWAVIQSDLIPDDYPSVTLCPITSDVDEPEEYRVRVEPSAHNGLRSTSLIMADKAHTFARHRVRARIGALDTDTLRSLDTALRVWLGLA